MTSWIFWARIGLAGSMKAGRTVMKKSPAFIDPARPILAQNVQLVMLYVLVATAIHTAIVLLAGAFEPVLTDPVRERRVRRVLAALLAAVAVWFGWSTGL